MLEKTAPSLKTQSLYLFSGKILSFIFRFIAPIILVRLLSKEEYGIYMQFNLITLTLIPLLGFGVSSSLYYFYPTGKNEIERACYVSQSYIVLIIVGLLFAFFYLIGGLKFNELIGINSLNNHLICIIIYIFFMHISNLSNVIFTVEKKILHNLFYFPIDIMTKTVILVSFAFALKNYSGCIYGLVVYSVLRFFYITAYFLKFLRNYLKKILISDYCLNS